MTIRYDGLYEYAAKHKLDYNELCSVVRAAAPQPSAEPVAWRRRERGGEWQYFGWQETGMTHELVARCNKDGFECEAIPAPQPAKREPLTDEQIDLMAHSDDEGDWNHLTYRDCWYEGYKAGARAIERYNGITGEQK